MPTYDYECYACRTVREVFHAITDQSERKCETCGKPLVRLISGGAGLVFKGPGFYINDYPKDGKGARNV